MRCAGCPLAQPIGYQMMGLQQYHEYPSMCHRLVYSVQGKENWSSFFVAPLKQNTKFGIADRLSIACSRPVRPFGVQQRGLKKAAERPSAGSQKTAGRSSAGSVTAAAVRKA